MSKKNSNLDLIRRGLLGLALQAWEARWIPVDVAGGIKDGIIGAIRDQQDAQAAQDAQEEAWIDRHFRG